MTMAPGAAGSADQLDQRIARDHRIGCGARVTSGTGAVELARSNASKPDAWTFITPHGPVTVPHGFGRADESLPRGHDCGCEKKKCQHSNFLPNRSA